MCVVVALLAAALAAAVGAQVAPSAPSAPSRSVELEVVGAGAVRHDPLVRFAPDVVPAGRRPRLVEVVPGSAAPLEAVQLDPRGREIAWRIAGDVAPGDTRRYRLEWIDGPTGALRPASRVSQRLESAGRAVAVFVAGSPELLPPLPAGVDPIYLRDGYLHPLWTPSGRVVTGDYPASHRHQHGVMFAWTRTLFEGRAIDFWNAAERQGSVKSGRSIARADGPVFAWLEAQLEHVEANTFDFSVLKDSWTLTASATPRWNVLDLGSTQGTNEDDSVEVLEYHYGGLAFRGPEAWEGADGVRVLTSAGAGRAEADGQRVRWIALFGTVDGAPVTVAALGHPSNFRAPQPVRVHPENPYFCFAPCRLGPFTIAPDAPLESRYRFVLADGELEAETIEALWQDYADPLVARPAE